MKRKGDPSIPVCKVCHRPGTMLSPLIKGVHAYCRKGAR